jgi:hypothetical protein
VEDNGSLTRVAAFPIGIDPDRFTEALETPEVKANIAQLLNRWEAAGTGRKGEGVGVGVGWGVRWGGACRERGAQGAIWGESEFNKKGGGGRRRSRQMDGCGSRGTALGTALYRDGCLPAHP